MQLGATSAYHLGPETHRILPEWFGLKTIKFAVHFCLIFIRLLLQGKWPTNSYSRKASVTKRKTKHDRSQAKGILAWWPFRNVFRFRGREKGGSVRAGEEMSCFLLEIRGRKGHQSRGRGGRERRGWEHVFGGGGGLNICFGAKIPTRLRTNTFALPLAVPHLSAMPREVHAD